LSDGLLVQRNERRGLVAYAVVCNDGHKYLVANPPRRHGYQPNAPALPASIVRVWNER
jgi:hypothetical protein